MYLRMITPQTMETVKQSIAKAKARNVMSIRFIVSIGKMYDVYVP